MNILMKHLQEAAEIPAGTMALISLMCGIAMYFVRSHLVIPGMVVVVYPMVLAFSVLANYGLIKLELFALNRYDQWLICTITSATIGVIGGLIVAAILARIFEHFQTKHRFERN